MTTETGVSKWQIDNWIQIEVGDERYPYYWAEPAFFEGEYVEESSVFAGHCWVVSGVLVLSNWKVRELLPDEWKTQEAADKAIAALPAWDKTKYWTMAKYLNPILMVSATNEPASDEECDEVMPKLKLTPRYERRAPAG